MPPFDRKLPPREAFPVAMDGEAFIVFLCICALFCRCDPRAATVTPDLVITGHSCQVCARGGGKGVAFFFLAAKILSDGMTIFDQFSQCLASFDVVLLAAGRGASKLRGGSVFFFFLAVPEVATSKKNFCFGVDATRPPFGPPRRAHFEAICCVENAACKPAEACKL